MRTMQMALIDDIIPLTFAFLFLDFSASAVFSHELPHMILSFARVRWSVRCRKETLRQRKDADHE
jgi:hypothetical protein